MWNGNLKKNTIYMNESTCKQLLPLNSRFFFNHKCAEWQRWDANAHEIKWNKYYSNDLITLCLSFKSNIVLTWLRFLFFFLCYLCGWKLLRHKLRHTGKHTKEYPNGLRWTIGAFRIYRGVSSLPENAMIDFRLYRFCFFFVSSIDAANW